MPRRWHRDLRGRRARGARLDLSLTPTDAWATSSNPRTSYAPVGRTGPTSNNHPHLHFELGIDGDGDGEVSWGFAGAERVNLWFGGVEYGQSNALTWRDVESFNCP